VESEAIAAKTQTLMQASMKLGEAMYKEQAAAAGPAGASHADDGVVDAEFEDVSGVKS
jgi:molecular chaperone DnaK